jgi:hypothetical protein
MSKLTKADKFIVIPALCLILAALIGVGIYVRNNPTTTQATVNIDPELQRRADKELSPQAIFKAVELKNKLRDRDAFLQECQTLTRDQLLETIEELTRLAGDCKE